jgi:transposase
MSRQEAVLLPFTRVEKRSRVYGTRRCPTCGTSCPKRSTGTRHLRDLGVGHPVVLEIRHSKHRCPRCKKYFNAPMEDLAEPGSLYTQRVRTTALAKVLVDGLPLEAVQEQMLREFHVHVPPTTLERWVAEAGEKDRPDGRVRAVDRGAFQRISVHR